MLKIILATLVVGLFGCEETPAPCIKGHTETQITYPNLSLTALGPQYAGIALIPVTEEVFVCDDSAN